MTAVVIDGVVVDPADAKISIFDRALWYGDGCFEVVRTWDGATPDLDAHFDRLYRTAEFLALKAIDRASLAVAVARCIAAAGPSATGDHRVRIALTRGLGSLHRNFAELGPGQSIIIAEPLPPQPRELALAVVDWPVAAHGEGRKTLAFLDHLYAQELARRAGAEEALRLDARGNVVEGATCNVFAVRTGVITTPPSGQGALPGIVRGRVLELCAALALTTRIATLELWELEEADEVFVTSSLRGVVPVTRIDGAPRVAGALSARLARAYEDAMRGLRHR